MGATNLVITADKLERRYSSIPCREPLPVRTMDALAYAYWFCIALRGLTSEQIPELPKEPDVIVAQIEHAHP